MVGQGGLGQITGKQRDHFYASFRAKAACLKHCQSLGGSRVGGHWEWQYFIFANYYLYYYNSFSQQFLQPSLLAMCHV